MDNEVFNQKDSISEKHFLTDFKQASESSITYEEAAIWIFSVFLNGPTIVTGNARLALFCKDASSREGTITFYVWVMNHLLKRYAMDAVSFNTDDKNSLI